MIFKILKIVFVSTFQLFKSSSSEVVFHAGRPPFFFKVVFVLSRPKNVTKHLLLISSYFGHLPVRSSSMGVVFHIFNNNKNCVGLYLISPKNVRKQVLLISSFLGHLPVRSSSMEVVFNI
jgi:hypothetical protein